MDNYHSSNALMKSFRSLLPLKMGQWTNATIVACIAASLPLLSAIMFRTYDYHVTPGWYEALRQFDFQFIIAEIGVIVWAHAKGMRFRPLFGSLDRFNKLAVIIFVATFAISSLFIAPQPVYSLLRASYWLVHICFGCAVFHFLVLGSKDETRRTADLWTAGLILFLPIIALHFALSPPPASLPNGNVIWSSAVPGAQSVRHLGFWAGIVAVMWIMCNGWFGNSPRSWLMRWVLASVLIAIIFWSGTRAAIVGLAGSLIIACLLMRKFPALSEISGMLLAIFAGAALSSIGLPPDASFGIFQPERYAAAGDIYTLGAGRFEIWIGSLTRFLESPIFGWGEGAILWDTKLSQGYHQQPHNSVIQFLYSWGALATAAFLFVASRLLWRLHVAAFSQPEILASLMVVDCSILMSMFDGVFYYARTIMPAVMAIAYCCAHIYNKKSISDTA